MNKIIFYDEGIFIISGVKYKENCIKHSCNFTKEKYKIRFINTQIYGIYIKYIKK